MGGACWLVWVVPDGPPGPGRHSASQAGNAVACPAAFTVSLVSTQSSRLAVCSSMLAGPPVGLPLIESRESSLTVRVTVTGVRRWGRTHSGTATWTKAKIARVTAIAGRERCRMIRTVVPRTTAKTAYPTGTRPRIAKDTGVSRLGRLPRVWLTVPSIGSDHQVTAQVSSPTAAAAPRVVRPSLVA